MFTFEISVADVAAAVDFARGEIAKRGGSMIGDDNSGSFTLPVAGCTLTGSYVTAGNVITVSVSADDPGVSPQVLESALASVFNGVIV